MPDDEAPVQRLTRRQKFHKFWRRWLLWTLLRSFLIVGAGVGVGTAYRATTPRLMAHARRVASLGQFDGYRWTSARNLLLYNWQPKGMARWQLDLTAQTLTSLGVEAHAIPAFRGDEAALRLTKQHSKTLVEGWNNPVTYGRAKVIPPPDYAAKLTVPDNVQISTGYFEESSQTRPVSFGQIALSPDKKRFACVCHSSRPVPWQSMLHRVVPLYKPDAVPRLYLLVSDREGKSTRTVGFVPAYNTARHSPYVLHGGIEHSFTMMKWTPDGKHISFAYGDGLYTVPVE